MPEAQIPQVVDEDRGAARKPAPRLHTFPPSSACGRRRSRGRLGSGTMSADLNQHAGWVHIRDAARMLAWELTGTVPSTLGGWLRRVRLPTGHSRPRGPDDFLRPTVGHRRTAAPLGGSKAHLHRQALCLASYDQEQDAAGERTGSTTGTVCSPGTAGLRTGRGVIDCQGADLAGVGRDRFGASQGESHRSPTPPPAPGHRHPRQCLDPTNAPTAHPPQQSSADVAVTPCRSPARTHLTGLRVLQTSELKQGGIAENARLDPFSPTAATR
ncbi:hypothetical protein S1361_37965 [Streptomyces cyanogenus]|uniref:Uncharacterized protein n=1 Tax=Streptomyces cyanogenus TaxID=80860 RepID=A0ABX7U6Z9_STRCY|nr:hypothetical protein S1361_37965 [Streptomyces cyanogenus]